MPVSRENNAMIYGVNKLADATAGHASNDHRSHCTLVVLIYFPKSIIKIDLFSTFFWNMSRDQAIIKETITAILLYLLIKDSLSTKTNNCPTTCIKNRCENGTGIRGVKIKEIVH